jgi:two-component system CheB/CheR fusion protein
MDSSAAGLDRVVVIGASAGGLEAIQELLGPLPPGGTATYVVAQHLAPEHPSQLVDPAAAWADRCAAAELRCQL